MSEAEAVLIAAVIAAVASIFVALSVRKAQRDQVLWESRRDLFTSFVLAAKECQRIQEGVYTDGRHREERDAIEKMDDLYSRMAIEARKARKSCSWQGASSNTLKKSTQSRCVTKESATPYGGRGCAMRLAT
ncbi:hypothetical protein [Nocardiopsis sp. CNS-639]|uniref:hypothetical protein n=1 Tax=Nocardiopsis sp. CNS-639 TaxID=1169153 RepID=UPI00035EBDBC|nr:hypothetical protein [Nocardiopsis sp. CNS-639]